MNGGRVEYNNWELDGGDNMDNGSNSTLNVYPSIDAIAEFKVLTSNYGAQYGRNGSGTVEVETKSGTKQFHGDAYEFLRNDAFNSPAWFQSRCRARIQEKRLRLHARRPDFCSRTSTTRIRPRHSSSGRKSGDERLVPGQLRSTVPFRIAERREISRIFVARTCNRRRPTTIRLSPPLPGFQIAQATVLISMRSRHDSRAQWCRHSFQ